MSRPAVSPVRLRSARRALLEWFDEHARGLPWRSRRSPWRVWVSEIMLQQTRVEAVVEPYRRFMKTFPSLGALANAREDDVLARWSGLGYYRRARLLHAGARVVVARHGGRVPRTRAELERIPGIGSYTAGALLSIAFGQPEAAVDANVSRVVARVGGVRDPRSAEGRAAVAAFASALVDCERPGDVNEALMDLGSAVCTARMARCGVCPLARTCRARQSGDPTAFAAPAPRKSPREVLLACAVVTDPGRRVMFLRRSRHDALLAGLWDLPCIELEDGADAAAALEELLHARSGLRLSFEGPLVSQRHEIVGRRIVASVYVASCMRRGRLPRNARFLGADDFDSVGLPALPIKILRALPGRLRDGGGFSAGP